MISELAEENTGSVKFSKVNVAEHIQAAQNYGVMGVPALFMFKGGEPVQKLVGLQSKAQLQSMIESASA